MLGLTTILLLVGAFWGSRPAQAAFLEDRLPLEIVVSSPVELVQATGKPVVLSGRQALTVVFSRPVIALGSDFGNQDQFGGLAPFALSCTGHPVPPGKGRWVTTTIARFDPDTDWPTDLNCQFKVNSSLTAYDGATVKLASPVDTKLTSSPLSMSYATVLSERAFNLTGGTWDANVGMPTDALPEVPPDGVLVVSFNYPVDLALLSQGLTLAPADSNIKLNVSKCVSQAAWATGTLEETSSGSTTPQTCASITFSSPLKPQTKYQLVLPQGTQYSAYTGPSGEVQTVALAGLRAFRIPLRQEFQQLKSAADYLYDSTSYRRLTLWLPHGLDPSVTVDQLTAQMSICKLNQPFSTKPTCGTSLPITGAKLRDPATLQITVAGLQPFTRYQISVKADDKTKDGFGLPLEASSTSWWTSQLSPFLALPQAQLVAAFTSGSRPSKWPVAVLGTDNTTVQAAVWSLELKSAADVAKLVAVVEQSNILVDDVLGAPSAKVDRGNPTTPTQLELALDATKNVHVVATCCSLSTYPTTKNVSSQGSLITTSSLLSSWVLSSDSSVLVWVTSPEPATPGPVANATAYLYSIQDTNITLAGTCTTDATGSCFVRITPPPLNTYVTLSGVVVGPSGAVSYTSVGSWGRSASSEYSGALVLDRSLLRPGDELHVTGYVGQKQPMGDESGGTWPVKAANVKNAVLSITPGWNGEQEVTVTVPVASDYGSVHTSIPVPASAKVGAYSLRLLLPTPTDNRRRNLLSAVLPTATGLAVHGLRGVSTSTEPYQGSATMGHGIVRRSAQQDSRSGSASSSIASSSDGSSGENTSDMMVLAYDNLVVSDPRPPTADLTVTVPAWAPPKGTVEVSVQATSYLGNDVSGAPITIAWLTSVANESQVVTTDATGKATATINLGSLPANKTSQAGDTLSIEVSWIGPTRERIVRTATVQLQDTARTVTLSRTLETRLPGVPFGVQVDVINSTDSASVKGVPVVVTLKPNATGGAACSNETSCRIVTGDVSYLASCQLALPCTGPFILSACTDDGSPQACTNTTIGLNATQWDAAPLAAWDEPQLTVNATSFKLSDVAGVSFQNSWGSGASALVTWGNTDGQLMTKYVSDLPTGYVTLPIQLGLLGCRGGCAVQVLVFVPPKTGATAPAGVPVSKLFDLNAPHVHALGPVSINIEEDSKLDVSLSLNSGVTTQVDGGYKALMSPGATAKVTVGVTQNGAPAADAEVTIVAVDKSILDLVPYPLRTPESDLAMNLAASISSALATQLVAPNALSDVFTTLFRRLGLDPWLPAETNLLPLTRRLTDWGYSRSPVDLNDTAYLDMYTSALTYSTARTGRGVTGVFKPVLSTVADSKANTPATAPKRAEDSDSSTSSSSSSSVRIASKFVATPLFTVVKANSNGEANAVFTAPPNLGTFVVRAYVASKGLTALGQAENSLIVRRTISLTASQPRIVRTGDQFYAGVLVAAPGLAADAAAFTITVKLQLVPPKGGAPAPVRLTSRSSTTKVTLSGTNNQVEARFRFKAVAVGSIDLKFTATDAAGVSDALLTTLPVLAPQSQVFVATSFAVRGDNTSKTWQEGLQLPAATPGSGGLQLTAGVGYLPAIIASTNAIATQRATVSSDQPLDAQTSLALAVVPALLAQYQQTATSTQQGNASQALDALSSLTNDDLGLLPYPPSQWGWMPTRADIILNAQAAYLLSAYNYSGPALKAAWDGVTGTSLPRWQVAAVRQLIKDAETSRAPPQGAPRAYDDWYTVGWVRLMLGAGWTATSCMDARADYLDGVCTSNSLVVGDLSLASQLAAANNGSLTIKLLTALTVQATGDTQYAAFLTTTANTLISSIRVQGRTAYFTDPLGSQSAAPRETQALALSLLVALNRPSDAALVQKVAAYLATAEDGSALDSFVKILPPVTPSAWVTAFTALTLTKYDQAVGSTKPDLSVSAAVGNTTVLEATFNAATVSQPPPETFTPWNKLPASPSTLKFAVEGTGEASVSAALSFVPRQLLSFPSYRGIWVTSVVQATDPTTGVAVGPPLKQVPLTSLVQVTIQVTTPDDLGAVTVEALTAGGLEPLDPLTTSGSDTGAVCPLAVWAGDAFSTRYWSWWWPLCPAQEVRPSSVTWKWQRLMAGTYTLTYSAVAATEGLFVLPPVKASVDSQPEVMGMTAATPFTVCGPKCKTVPVADTGAPKSCPKDCSGHGACNTNTGECVCAASWSGADCSVQRT